MKGSFSVKFQTLHQENRRTEEVVRQNFRSSSAPDIWNIRQTFRVNFWNWFGPSRWNFRHCIGRTWVPRRSHKKILDSAVLLIFQTFVKLSARIFGNDAVFLAEISYIVSGEHEDRGNGTTKFYNQLCSYYYKPSLNF